MRRYLAASFSTLAAVLVLGPAVAQAAVVRAVITWNKANDIDLHVYDDQGNHAFYGDSERDPERRAVRATRQQRRAGVLHRQRRPQHPGLRLPGLLLRLGRRAAPARPDQHELRSTRRGGTHHGDVHAQPPGRLPRTSAPSRSSRRTSIDGRRLRRNRQLRRPSQYRSGRHRRRRHRRCMRRRRHRRRRRPGRLRQLPAERERGPARHRRRRARGRLRPDPQRQPAAGRAGHAGHAARRRLRRPRRPRRCSGRAWSRARCPARSGSS